MRRRRKLHASAQETAAKCAAIAVAVAAKEVTAAKDATALERRDGRGRDGVGWVEGRGQGGGEAGVRGRGGGRGRNVRGLGPLASGRDRPRHPLCPHQPHQLNTPRPRRRRRSGRRRCA